MSDSISTIVDGQTLIIYNNRKPDVYPYSEIYDPDIPLSGKTVPSLMSVIIKDDGSLWYVDSVDETTFKSTLKPCGIVSSEEHSTQIISYGNDRFCLYHDNRTQPFKLVVDAKLLFAGNNLVEYGLYRTNTDGNEEIISLYVDAADKIVSNRIPMASISSLHPAYKFPTNCHTTHVLEEGEPILLRVFNNLGNIAAEVTIFVRNAIWLNDLASHVNPIVKLDATCLQMKGDDFYIYEKQDPSHLNIQPFLVYANGDIVDVPIDNMQCFLYGLEYFIPSYPGYSQNLIIKYFLSHRETALNGEGPSASFVTCTKQLTVLNNLNEYSVKITVIPYYEQTSATWRLRFFAYGDHRDAVYDITDQVTFDEQYPFLGTNSMWGHEQHIVFNYDLQQVFHTDNPMPGSQALWLTVWDPTTYERYTYRDSAEDTFIYGVDGSVTRRPVIHYDETINQYFIPTSIFRNKEAVLESFYLLARPPFNSKIEVTPVTPTYFTIRDIMSGQLIVGGPIPIENYGQAWNTILGIPNLVGSSVMVEFLTLNGSTFQLLYGVPVDVYKSETGYNTIANAFSWEG